MKKIWKEIKLEEDTKLIEKIQNKFNVSELIARIIASKGLEKDEDIQKFLAPTRNDFHDPYEMPDMQKAVDRILKAITTNEKIAIYGDYDVDGITSTTLLKKYFKDRGIEVGTYIPNRLNEGYGLNNEAINKIAEDGYNLIITVDTGITANEQVELARSLNMDVIVTDHHEPAETIPDAVAVVDCKRSDSKYPFRELCGCGVAFKLTQALTKALDISENESLKYLDLAAIGTISDIVPLEDENRVIAKLGLLLVAQTKNVGLRALFNQCKFKTIDSQTVSFGISPRVNACGRMGHQEEALELLVTDDPIVARKKAAIIEDYNKQRQDIEKRIFEEALWEIASDPRYETAKALVVGKKKWHNGVIGIISSKITERFYKPSILINFEEDEAHGSGRSIEGFDLHEAALKCSNHLIQAGGHEMAIGCKLKTSEFEAFRDEFEKYANENITDEMMVPVLNIDYEISDKNFDLKSIEELQLLEPFGAGNNKPTFIYKDLRIDGIRKLSEGKHMKLQLQSGNNTVEAIGFGIGELADEYQIGDRIDVAGNLEINEYNGKKNIQIVLKDLRKSIK